MKNTRTKTLLYLGTGAMLVALGIAIMVILPKKAFYLDYGDKNTHDAYIFVYKNDVIWSYGDSTIESVNQENGNQALVLAYKNPGEKGATYRNTLTISKNGATMNSEQYTEMSPMNIFNPTFYKNPFTYLMTILRMR